LTIGLATSRRRTFQPIVLSVLAVATAVGIGGLVTRSTHGAVALSAAVLLGAIIVTAERRPTVQVLMGVVVFMSALVDLPSRLPTVAAFSSQAVLTAGYVAAAAVIVIGTPDRIVSRATQGYKPLLLFTTWACLSLAWATPSVAAVQNILVFVALPTAIFVGFWTAQVTANPPEFGERLFIIATLVSCVLYAGSIAYSGLGGGAVVGSRSFGLYAILSAAWMAAGWRYRCRWARLLLLLTTSLVVLSLSRTAFAAILIIIAVAWMDFRTFGGFLRLVLSVAAVSAIGVALVMFVPPLHNRFFTGDLQTVDAGPSINVTGRFDLWRATWNSYLTSPIIGHGAGSADVLITKEFGNGIGHPHNDYLRVLHDDGIVGGVLLVAALLGLMRGRWRDWRRPSVHSSPAEQRLHAAALLATLGVALAMFTDNVLTYIFVMGPLGVLLGISAGTAYRSRLVTSRGDAQ
jgi:O-antigen ligase